MRVCVFKLNISSDSNLIKLFLNAWILIVIFWNYYFKRWVRCRLWRRNIVASAFRNCWLKELLTSSFYFIIKFLFAFAIRLRVFSINLKFFSKFSKRGVWASISFSPSFISFKIKSVVIVNYASSFSLRKIETIKIVRL